MLEPYQLLPPLTEDEYESLKADIRERGVLVAIEFDENGDVLDGHHRLRIAHELGITDYPKVIREGWTEVQKRSHARSLNVRRRHLNQEQKRQLIAQEILENPAASNNSVAKRLGVSDMTVASVRGGLGSEGQSEVVQGADGKFYPAKRAENATKFLDSYFPAVNDSKTGENPSISDVSLSFPPESSDNFTKSEFLKLTFALEPDDYELVMEAIRTVKKYMKLSMAAEALVWMAKTTVDASADWERANT